MTDSKMFLEMSEAHKRSRSLFERDQALAEQTGYGFLDWVRKRCPATFAFLDPWCSVVERSGRYHVIVRKETAGTAEFQFGLTKAYATALEKFLAHPENIPLALASPDVKRPEFKTDNISLHNVLDVLESYLKEGTLR